MNKIAMIGTGYVGLVSGSLLSDFGNEVICVDIDSIKIDLLNDGHMTIYEQGLDDIVKRNVINKRLSFTTNIDKAIQDSDIIFIAVGTPSNENGDADLKYVYQVAQKIGENLNSYKIIVDKSTVPVGTGREVERIINTFSNQKGLNHKFDVVSNPEFLREGSAVYDFTHPDRIVLGSDSVYAIKKMTEIYDVLYKLETPFVNCSLETAEMIKYASNSFLAMKITFINEIANLCEKIGANVNQVAIGIGKDGRIGSKFLHAGPGYGGSCFPKDTRALSSIGKQNNSPLTLVDATIIANENQKYKMIEKIESSMGTVKNKTIAILGVTFKPNTDDMRESPALKIIPELIKMGALLRVYDPMFSKEGPMRFNDVLNDMYVAENQLDAIIGSDALVILTDWSNFRNIDFPKVKSLMKDTYFFDLRNIYKKEQVELNGFRYFGVGVL